VDNWGVLEKTTYLVDLEAFMQSGECSCWHFQMRLRGQLLRMSRDERRANRIRCKHIIQVREFAKRDENFDVLLAALPNQEEQC
jgi:hypothetical protein